MAWGANKIGRKIIIFNKARKFINILVEGFKIWEKISGRSDP